MDCFVYFLIVVPLFQSMSDRQEQGLVRLYTASCFWQWETLELWESSKDFLFLRSSCKTPILYWFCCQGFVNFSKHHTSLNGYNNKTINVYFDIYNFDYKNIEANSERREV